MYFVLSTYIFIVYDILEGLHANRIFPYLLRLHSLVVLIFRCEVTNK